RNAMNSRRLMCSPLTRVSAYHTARGEAPCAIQQICTDDVADGSISALGLGPLNVSFALNSDRSADMPVGPPRATNGLTHPQQIWGADVGSLNWLLFHRGVKSALHFHNVVLVESVNLDDGSGRIGRLAPQFFLHFVYEPPEPEHIGYVD